MSHLSLADSYFWFDFHHECKGTDWSPLSKLLDILTDKLSAFDCFQARLTHGFDAPEKLGPHSFSVSSRQVGAVRTNCMDSLDRTNVVQSVLGRHALLKQLWRLGLATQPRGLAFEPFQPQVEAAFREAWTVNADRLSLIYSGTPALKTDFTRTGKRTYKGIINDGIYSVQRYYRNNFCDGYYNDCIDVALGKITHQMPLRRRSFFSPLKLTMLSVMMVDHPC